MDAQTAVVDLNGEILLQNLGSSPIRLAIIKLFIIEHIFLSKAFVLHKKALNKQETSASI